MNNPNFFTLADGGVIISASPNMHLEYEIRSCISHKMLIPAHFSLSYIPLHPLKHNSFRKDISVEQISDFLYKKTSLSYLRKWWRQHLCNYQLSQLSLLQIQSLFLTSCSKQTCAITCVIADDNYTQFYLRVFTVGGKQKSICTSVIFCLYMWTVNHKEC